ncbi:MAG: EAL domain-containing protein [Lachnospiraceae bacterium]
MKNEKLLKRTILLTILGFLAVLIGGCAYAAHMRAKITQECEDTLEAAARQNGRNFATQFDHNVKSLETAAEIFTLSRGKFSTGELQLLESTRKSLGAVTCGVYLADGTCCLSTGEQYTIGDNEAWNHVSTGDIYIGRMQNHELLKGDGLAICVPFNNGQNNQTIGMVFAHYELDSFIDMVSESVYGNEGYSFIADSDGEILVPARQIISYADDGSIMVEGHNMERFKALYQVIKNGERKVVTYTDISGQKMSVLGVLMNHYEQFAVISLVPSEVVYGQQRVMEIALLAVLGTLLVAIIFFLLYFIREKKRVAREVWRTTNVDSLTGLSTKPRHKEEVAEILAESKGKFAYATCDVSNFKYVNETYGYEYGNVALKYIAASLKQALKKNELLSRTSGDHFCMLLRYENEDKLEERLYQMLDKASRFPIDREGNSYKAVFSCGVYLIQEERDVNKIRSRANVARKGIKKSFTTQIAFYNEEDYAKELLTRELENDLRRALDEREFIVYLQPKYDIVSEKMIGAEALVRWMHPKKGIIPPGQFIPMCEENGFIREIDFYVLEEVCRKLRQWMNDGKKPVTISTNFSRLHLDDPEFVKHLVKTVESYQISPNYIEIELTETAVYEEMETLLNVMHEIKEAGFGLAMDDFGSGYSSLNLLREMPVDVLKLDKGFLNDCEGEQTKREKSIISHVISMAKDLEISVLAEGVETEQQKEFLKDSSCDMIQGYYYAKPMPMELFEQYMA